MSKFSIDKSMLRIKRRQKIISISTIVIFLIGLGFVWRVWLVPKPILPHGIQKQLNFVAVLPKTNEQLSVDKSNIKFDKDNSVLNLIVAYQNIPITVTEQAYPDVLIYDRLVGTLKQYDEVQTKVGKVALTRPDAASGSQVAVINVNNQTLVFAKTSQDLTKDQWQQFFNALEISK